jgi:hypothetical protein
MTLKEKLDALRANCEFVCGGGVVGPATAYFDTTEDDKGVSMRYTYISQRGSLIKPEGGDVYLPPFSKEEEPTEANIDRCIAFFFEGFKEIDADMRDSGQGIVWRTPPRIVYNEDSGELYIRARYAFAYPCKIVFPGINGGIRDVVTFNGGCARN